MNVHRFEASVFFFLIDILLSKSVVFGLIPTKTLWRVHLVFCLLGPEMDVDVFLLFLGFSLCGCYCKYC